MLLEIGFESKKTQNAFVKLIFLLGNKFPKIVLKFHYVHYGDFRSVSYVFVLKAVSGNLIQRIESIVLVKMCTRHRVTYLTSPS